VEQIKAIFLEEGIKEFVQSWYPRSTVANKFNYELSRRAFFAKGKMPNPQTSDSAIRNKSINTC